MKSLPSYQLIFENTGTATLIIEEDATITLVNSECEKLSGYTKDELENRMKWHSLVHEDDLLVMMSRQAKRRKDPESVPTTYEFRLRHRSGAVKNILLTLAFIPETTQSIVALQDITGRKETEKALEEHLETEKVISRLSRQFVMMPGDRIDDAVNEALGTIGVFTRADRAYLFLLSKDRNRMYNTHEWCADGIPRQKENLQNLETTQAVWTFEILRKNGDINITSLDQIPPHGEYEKKTLAEQGIQSLAVVPLLFNDELEGFVGLDSVRKERKWPKATFLLLRTVGDVILNALERKHFEEELEQSNRKYMDFVRFLPQVVFETDEDFQLTFINKSTKKLFGYSVDDLKRGISIYDLIDESQMEQAEVNIGRVFNGAVTEGSEYTGVTRTGKRFPILIYSSPVYREGIITGIRGIIIDLTVRKMLEEQLQYSRQMQAIGRLAGGIAHDFNNMLTSIIGFCHTLKLESGITEPMTKTIDHILHVAMSGSSLSQQLLTFSKKQIISPRELDLNQSIEKSIAMLQHLIRDDITLVKDFDDTLEKVVMDPAQVDQIVMNCVLNSADALPDGGEIIIQTRMDSAESGTLALDGGEMEGDYVRLLIIDHGHGFDDSVKQKVFEPFFTTKEIGEGSGLGLSIVYGIVEQNRGALEIESKPGTGTTVKICIPAVKKD